MSQENVALLRRAFEAWNAGDMDAVRDRSDFAEAGEHVVVRLIWHAAGVGPETNLEFTAVYTVRKGRVFYVEHFWDHNEALEAAGLGGRTGLSAGLDPPRH